MYSIFICGGKCSRSRLLLQNLTCRWEWENIIFETTIARRELSFSKFKSGSTYIENGGEFATSCKWQFVEMKLCERILVTFQATTHILPYRSSNWKCESTFDGVKISLECMKLRERISLTFQPRTHVSPLRVHWKVLKYFRWWISLKFQPRIHISPLRVHLL